MNRVAPLAFVILALALAGAAPDAPSASPPTVGARLEREGNRITFAGIEPLAPTELKRGAPAGFRVYWLAESRPGDKYPPGLGEVKLTFDGVQYNAVTNPTSSKPLSPDVLVHDVDRFAKERPGALRLAQLERRSGAPAAVLEAHLWGAPLATWRSGTAEIQIGLLEPGAAAKPKVLRWEWFTWALGASSKPGAEPSTSPTSGR